METQLEQYQGSINDRNHLADDSGSISDVPDKPGCADDACLSGSTMGTLTSDVSPGDNYVDMGECGNKSDVNVSHTDSFALDALPEDSSLPMTCGGPDPDALTTTSADVAEPWHQSLSLSNYPTGPWLDLETSATWSGVDISTTSPPSGMRSDAMYLRPPFVLPEEQRTSTVHGFGLNGPEDNQSFEGEATITFQQTTTIRPYYELSPRRSVSPETIQGSRVEGSDSKLKDLAPRHSDNEPSSQPNDDVYGEAQPHRQRSRSAERRERNRLAAAKCRGRKRVSMTELTTTAQEMQTLNRSLQEQVRHLQDERARLQDLVLDLKLGNKGACHVVQQYHHRYDLGELAGKDVPTE